MPGLEKQTPAFAGYRWCWPDERRHGLVLPGWRERGRPIELRCQAREGGRLHF